MSEKDSFLEIFEEVGLVMKDTEMKTVNAFDDILSGTPERYVEVVNNLLLLVPPERHPTAIKLFENRRQIGLMKNESPR